MLEMNQLLSRRSATDYKRRCDYLSFSPSVLTRLASTAKDGRLSNGCVCVCDGVNVTEGDKESRVVNEERESALAVMRRDARVRAAARDEILKERWSILLPV